jgi:hypothetical protein
MYWQLKITTASESTSNLLINLKYLAMMKDEGGNVARVCTPSIMQNEQHFVAGELPHELDVQMEGH